MAQAELEEIIRLPQLAENLDKYKSECKVPVINQLIKKEAAFWRTRAKGENLKHDDKNTRYFHENVRQRRQRNWIKGLKDEQGVWRDEEEDLQDMVKSYFMNLFKAATSLDMDPIEPCISQEVNEALTKDFTGEEV